MRALILLPLLTGGCALFTGQPEGNWLFTATELSAVCDGVAADDLQEPWQTLGTTYRLATDLDEDGDYILQISGLNLQGTASRDGFNLSTRDETRLTDGEDCPSYSEGTMVTVRGTWGDDLTFQGTGSSETWKRADDCYGLTVDHVCDYEFRLQGVLLNSSARDHLTEGVSSSGVFAALGGGGGGYF